ncbi:MAG: TonB-dependent receptor [Bacteroidales bacterium]|nr:TonB-dependent receptor [Bacteroidales bacterium]MCB9029036.1 TonB-dependent receptor [Bacteroidales bacterium]MDD3736413.1 TonB-dependent receptor [Bacteroidales bacterium]HNT93336.1 TonB-dependent receptor [Bacteroidales bacterium]HPE22337.1 TonB-dependent receptor [Bacteroidales bacterium]
MKISSLLILLFLLSYSLVAQQGGGVIRGQVVDATSNEPVPFASVVIWNTTTGAMTDFDGYFSFTGVQPGFVELRVSSVGYKTYVSEAVMVTNNNEVNLVIPLETTVVEVGDVIVRPSPFRKSVESPISARIISIQEIELNPGGNRDISRVIQSFPGVASTPAFRNDVIVRGGGPNENRFFIDNVEIPYLNHFSTQGSSGGPTGIINVDFVRSVDFLSGAFPASRGNALSSVMDFTMIDGNREKRSLRATVGASDLGLTFNGPVGERSSLIVSARRSYLQFLFGVIGLPFLPTYTDFQFKYKVKFDQKNELTVLGIGAKDDFRLNLDANETEYQRYILGYIPTQEQYSYTVGAVYRHFRSNGSDMFVLSRNYLNNTQFKYLNNDDSNPDNKTYDYQSGEGDIRLRYERTVVWPNSLRVSYGAGTEMSRYRNDTFRQFFGGGGLETEFYNTNLVFFKYAAFGQVSRAFIDEKLKLSFGLRTDANSFSSVMANPLTQISPRLSASYSLNSLLNLNFNVGRYYQLPPYTSLGLKDNSGNYINRENELKYIAADHLVGGVEVIPDERLQFTLEGFYKLYSDYPFSVADQVPLSTKSAGYGVFGNEALVSTAEGRAYGLELMGRARDLEGLNMVFSYTFVRSEFEGTDGKYIPTAWDNRHLLSVTATKSIGKSWDAGFRWRYVGGAPYTPFDTDKSSYIDAWNVTGQGYLDYSRFNSERLKGFSQLDIRVDKQFYFDKWSLMLYVDVQNVYNFKADQPDILVLQTNNDGSALVDPLDPERYLLKFIEAEAGTVLPTIGIIIEI